MSMKRTRSLGRNLLTISLLSVGMVVASWAASATMEETYSASLAPGGRFEIDNTVGDVQIKGADVDRVRIVVRIEVDDADNKEEAERLLQEVEIRVEETPGAVYVRTRVPGEFLDDKDEDYVVDYEVTVPHQVQIDAELDVGRVAVEGVSGRVAVETHVGEIDVDMQEGTVEAKANVGRIKVNLGRLAGEGRLRFETNVGDVELTLPVDIAVHLDASVNIGSVDSDFDVRTERDSWIGERLSGDINGGGPTLKARANIGRVRLQSR